jgi:hypothetical protein
MNKDPFLDDAIDGFSLLSPDVLQKDLKLLNNKLKKQLNKRNPLPVLFFKIAASIVIIVAISTIIKITSNKTPFQNLSYNNIDSIKSEIIEKQTLQPIENADIKINRTVEPVKPNNQKKKKTETDNFSKSKKQKKTKTKTTTQTDISVNGKSQNKTSEIAASNTIPPETVTIKLSEPNTTNNKKTKLYNQEKMQGIQSAPLLKQNNIEIEIIYKEKYTVHTVPNGGIKEFENYINNNVNTDTLKSSVSARYLLTIDSKGNLYYIKLKDEKTVINKKLFQLITESFPWQPASNKGKNIKEKVILKITIKIE